MLVPQDHVGREFPYLMKLHVIQPTSSTSYTIDTVFLFIFPLPPAMMKGLFRGLRCIFDADNEKEPEIQIGNPTDVKHVAHIGCDGPSTPAPSWMNEYQGGSESQSGETGSKDPLPSTGGPSPSRPAKTKQSRRQAASSSPGMESPNMNPKPRKSKNINVDSSSSTANETSSRTRRIKNSILGSESPAQETNARRTRKKKGSTGDGTARSSKTKNKDPSNTDGSGLDSGCSDGVCQKPDD